MSTTNLTTAFKAGQIYRNSDPHGSGWCKHGIVQIAEKRDGGLLAVDTYWGEYGCDGYQRIPSEIERYLTFVIDIADCRKSHRDEYEIYSDADRCYIPIGGGSEKFLIRKDAKPDLERHAEWLKRKIAELEADIHFAERRLGEFKTTLSSLGEARLLLEAEIASGSR